MPIGDNAMWDEIIATNKEYARIRDRPFPIYEDLVFLFAKNIANGRRGNTTAMPIVVRDDDSSDDDMNEIDLDDTNINTEQHNHCPSHISAPTNSFMMNESFDQNMPFVQIDSPISVAPALPDDSPSSSTGKRQKPSATKAARKKKIPSGAYQAMIDLAEQGKIRLQMCHDVYKKEQLYSGELCWARLREKLPNLTIEQKVAIVECFKDASNRWAFMTCEDDMLLPWLMPHINEYYCKNQRTDSPHSSAMPTPSTGLGSTSFSFGFGCAARIGATPPGQSSTIQTGSSFGQGGNMPSIQTLGLGKVVSRFNAPRVSDGNDTPFNLGSWPGNVDTSGTEPSN